MKKLAVPFLVIAVSALLAAGCGGKSRNKAYASVQAYAAALESICTPAKKQIAALHANTPAAIASKGSQVRDIIDKAVDRMDKLQPPDQVKDAADDFISKSREEGDKIDELVDAAKKGDLAKIQEVSRDIQSIDAATNADARKIGANACATGS